MSDSLGMSRVTITLGREGRVVKRAGGPEDDEGTMNGVPIQGGKRSVRDRLGGIVEDRSDSYNKRQRGESTSNSVDMCLRKDDLRFKLMQKSNGQGSLNSEPGQSFDLRDKLSRRTSGPSEDIIAMRPPESFDSMRPFVPDPRITSMTRYPVIEARDVSILGRFPPSRNPNGLSVSGPPRSSSWTLENLRRRSPANLRRRSPEELRRRSPQGLRQRSPEGLRQRSPDVLRRRSREGLRLRSPEGFRRQSPEGLGRRAPNGMRRGSPEGLRRRSPESLRRPPEGLRRQSPQFLRRRSPEVLRRRSPEVLRRRSPEVLRRRSPEVLRRRSPEGLRERPVEGLRRRSPERPFHPSTARGHSPLRNREDIQRRPLIRPYDEERSTAYLRMSPKRAVRSSPYLTQSSLPASLNSVVPVSRYPQAGGVVQKAASGADVPPTVDSFLHSIGMEKYAIFFKAEEIDLNALRQLGDGDLKDLGIPMGPRKTILQAVMSRSRRQL
ncbi:uncharacterized protein LOC141644257 [Silene latifolia]|uniref:uncharacterized protein LOC141644257 n=1 Tax=Silene latifolia TaxID=37657 RepID=UPI003D7898AB